MIKPFFVISNHLSKVSPKLGMWIWRQFLIVGQSQIFIENVRELHPCVIWREKQKTQKSSQFRWWLNFCVFSFLHWSVHLKELGSCSDGCDGFEIIMDLATQNLTLIIRFCFSPAGFVYFGINVTNLTKPIHYLLGFCQWSLTHPTIFMILTKTTSKIFFVFCLFWLLAGFPSESSQLRPSSRFQLPSRPVSASQPFRRSLSLWSFLGSLSSSTDSQFHQLSSNCRLPRQPMKDKEAEPASF